VSSDDSTRRTAKNQNLGRHVKKCSLYKLFTTILSRRLNHVISTKKMHNHSDLLTSHEQVGFEQTEGCAEHVLELESCVHHARHRSKDLVVCFLDLANAFGSVPHILITEMLERLGLGGKFRHLIEDLYTDATMRVQAGKGITDAIEINAGVKQGDPISPTLFCLALEYLIRNLKHRHPQTGYQWFEGHSTFLLAYADDLAIVTSSQGEMKKVLRDLSSMASMCGLRFKPAKCATLCLEKGKATDTQFKIQSQSMPAMKHADFYTYLGVPIGVGLRSSEIHAPLLERASAHVQKIASSALAPWQKIDAIKTFITPRFLYTFSMCDIKHTDLRPIDKLIRRTIKDALNLPHLGGDAEYVWIPSSQGGAGVFPLADLSDMAVICHAFRMLTSRRSLTRQVAWSGLRQVVGGALRRAATVNDLSDYLNGRQTGDWQEATYSQGTSLFSRARKAVLRLRERVPLHFSIVEGEELSVRVDDATTVEQHKRAQLHKVLRCALGAKYARDLAAKPSHGKVFRRVQSHRSNYQFLIDGKYMSYGAFKFIHRARLNLLSLNAHSRSGGKSELCRRCGKWRETLPHVLNHCGAHLSRRITQRHNAVQDRLVEYIRKYSPHGTQVQVGRVCSVAGRQVKPDILVRDYKSKRIFIIDVQCPHEALDQAGTDPFTRSRLDKIGKYKLEAEFYERQGFTVFLDALIVGSLGTFDPLNSDLLRELGIPLTQARTLSRRLVADCVEQSKNIYWDHVLGDKFYLNQPSSLAGGTGEYTTHYSLRSTLDAALERSTPVCASKSGRGPRHHATPSVSMTTKEGQRRPRQKPPWHTV